MRQHLRSPTPPMGWNSWDVYGASVNEAEVVANAQYMAEHLLPYGWEYVVVDIQWYEPHAVGSAYRRFARLEVDEFSRLVPASNRFPSAADGAGFAPLALRIHALGLKFGLHLMRGIPRQAVHENSPILGTHQRAQDIAANSICAWNTDMYGVDALAPGAQSYYDSVFALFASWGVDFVKVDDVLSPYAEGEIALIRRAIDRCDRQIVLSLSCGPTDLSHGAHLRRNAEMWRMTGDFWDDWTDLVRMFDFCAEWTGFVGDGHWADADMLPLGRLAIRSNEHGRGERWTRLTHDEQITMMTLWCIARSPLMVGCDLPSNDAWTLDLLTNADVLRVLKESSNGSQVLRTDGVAGGYIVWTADGSDGSTYLAVFNTGFVAATIELPLDAVGLPESVACRDLWAGRDVGRVTHTLVTEVASHGARLFRAVP